MKRTAKEKPLEPIDGKFKHSVAKRRQWCVNNGHPLAFLNLSLSAKYGRDMWRCLCGMRETDPSSSTTKAVRRKGTGSTGKGKF